MFFWVELPEGVDARRCCRRRSSAASPSCRARRSTPARRAPNTLRLSFVTVAPSAIERGIAALAAALRDGDARVRRPSAELRDEPLRLHAGRRLHRDGAARQSARRRARRRRARRRADAGVRALDQPERDDLPARAHRRRRRLPRPHLHARRRAAVRRPSDARQLPRVAASAAAGRSAAGEVVQQCGVGLVRIRRDGGRRGVRGAAARAAAEVDAGDARRRSLAALGVATASAASPRSGSTTARAGSALLLDSAATVLALEPDAARR